MSLRSALGDANSTLGPTLLFGAALTSFAAAGVLGATGLRVFALTAGTTSLATSAAVLVIALGGGLGATLGARRDALAGDGGAALWGLALRQCSLAALLALSPILFRAARAIYLLFWPLIGAGDAGAWILRCAAGLGLFCLPAALLGSLVPRLVAIVRGDDEEAAVAPGFVLGLMAAGCGLGLMMGGAVLLPTLGLRGTFLMGLALSGMGASGSVLLAILVPGWRAGAPAVAPPGASGAGGSAAAVDAPPAQAMPPDRPPTAGQEARSGHLPSLLVGFALAGAWVAWDRTMAFLVGPTDANGSLVAGLLILGVALGGFVAAALGSAPFPGCSAVLVAAGSMAAYGSMFLVPWLAETTASLAPRYLAGGQPLLLTAFVGSILVVPTALLLGLGQTWIAARRHPGGPVSGAAGALAAIGGGAAAALIATPLVLIPAFGIRRTVCLVAAIGLLAALVLIAEARFQRPATRGSLAVGILALMVVLGGFPAAWDPRPVASGIYRYAAHAKERFGSVERWIAARQRGSSPLFYREGSEASVIVEESVQLTPGLPLVETETLTIDGRAAAGTGTDLRTQVLTGEIPLLMHGPTGKALLIDFLTGVTAGSILRHPVRSLTVIEREPAMLRAGGVFTELANNPLGDARITTIADDPRARLTADRTRYEVIVLGASDPWLPHVSGLITREGYALLKDRLADGGLVAQRVSLASADDGATRIMLRTFAQSFEAVSVFQLTPDDLLLVGSSRPIALDAAGLKATTAANPAVAADLRRVVVVGENEVLLTVRLGGDGLRRLLGPGPINDDDRARVTVAAARDLSVHRNPDLVQAIDGAWEGFPSVLANYGSTPREKSDFLYALAKSYLGLTADPVRALDIARELTGLGETARARWVTGEARLQQKDVDGAIGEWEGVLALEPDNLDALFSLGMFHLDMRDYFRADPYLSRAAKAHGDTPVVLYHYGRNLFYLGRYKEALETLLRARQIGAGQESYPLVDYLAGVSEARLGRDDEAIKSLQDYLKWAYEQSMLTRVEVDAHLKLAEVFDRKGKRFDALKERQKADGLRQRIDAWARSQPGGGEAAGPADAGPPSGAAGPPSGVLGPPAAGASPAPAAGAPSTPPPPPGP